MKKRTISLLLAVMLMLSLAVPTLAASVNDYQVVFSNFNSASVKGGPVYFSDFEVVGGDLLVQSITNYHWNGGKGSTPGAISIYDWDDNLIGKWQATGRNQNTY